MGGLTLLEDTSFKLRRGELVLLVGPSGTGKTILLKVLAGILRHGQQSLHVQGDLRFEGEDLLRRRPAPGRIGILFQDHALFDELDPHANVLFALRHRGRKAANPALSATAEKKIVDDLLEHLGVPGHALLRTLSGGQLQRVALARTLALNPELLLYDEPTTGLDPANAKKVAQLIRDSHGDGARTSLVVTHDTRNLTTVADRILLLDPEHRKLEEVSANQVDERLAAMGGELSSPSKAQARRPLVPARRFLEATTDVVVAGLDAVRHLIPLYPRQRYGRSYLRHMLGLTASFGAFAYVAMAGLIVGFVATYFTFEHLPRRTFTEPLFIDHILRAMGYLMYRVLVPVLLTVLIAARTGAAIASDIGNKVYSRQFDALRSFGVVPSRYLLTSSLWAMLLAMPLLALLMFGIAQVVSLAVFIHTHPEETYFFWDQNFHRSLRIPDEFWWRGSGWLLLKIELCAFGTAAIAYYQGARDKSAATDVSGSVTRTIIAASLFVLLVHFLLAFVEF